MRYEDIEFEWDDEKDRINRGKHRVSFNTAAAIFKYSVIEHVDDREDYGEVRYVALGRVETEIFKVTYTWRGKKLIRIINAKKASRHERELYYGSTYSQ